MKPGKTISIILVSVLAFSSMASFSQQGQFAGAGANRADEVGRDRPYDWDGMSEGERTQDRTRIDARDQEKNRDRMHDSANMNDGDIYGSKLMTVTERKQYRKELDNSETQASRKEFHIRHEARMQERALLKDEDLVPPGQGPIFGGELMSVKERNEFREQLRVYGTEQDREKIQAQHRSRINERADALGVKVEETE